MSILLYPEFFNDVFWPIMQPGSSSHTAVPCRLGYVANSLLGERPKKGQMVLDEAGSFAGTFGLMHEDHAMLAGAMGWLPDDTRLFEAVNLARAAGIEYAFEFAEMKESTHINAMKFELTGESGKVVSLVGDSTGGGMIETKLVNGYPLRVKGDCYVNLAFDLHDNVTVAQMERITAHLAGCLESGKSCVDGKGALHFIKVAELPDLEATRAMLPGIQVELLKPVLPVITRPERKPQLFDTMTRWREIAAERKLPLWEVAIQYEMDATG